MKKIQSLAMMTAIALTGTAGLTACSSENVEDNSKVVYNEEGQAGVKPEFVISIPRKVVGPVETRQADNVTQNMGSVDQFRGLDNIRLIPFNAEPTTTSTKLSDIMRLSPITTLSSPGAINYKVYADQFVPVTTKHFLFYAKAVDAAADVPITTMADKFHYGILNSNGLTDETFTSPSSIGFSLEPINTSTAEQQGDATGQALVALLTSIANTTVSDATAPHDKWSTTTNMIMQKLYTNFTATTTASSSSVAIILSRLYFALAPVQSGDAAYKLATAIKAKITAACSGTPIEGSPVSLTAAYTGYPGNLGLPDGAARVSWNSTSNAFADITASYGRGNNVLITDYVYPAALWYYVSTPLKAANEIKSLNYSGAGNWDGVINDVYGATAADEVGASTMSVALTNPVEYGVGRVETKIVMGSGPYYDANGQTVTTGSGYTLKGFLLGGQNSVGFDFTSIGNENLTIFDSDMDGRNITATPGTTAGTNQTLALETKTDQVVYAALELVNGGSDFQGADGIIPAGGTFYLTVKLNPKAASNYASGTLDKIVIKDHVTKVDVTIKNGTASDAEYIKDTDGKPIGVDTDGDGTPDPYDVDGDGVPDTIITDPTDPTIIGWDTDGDGQIDIPIVPDGDGDYPDAPPVEPEGLGTATNGIPDMSSPGVELGTSVNLEWQEGLILKPEV